MTYKIRKCFAPLLVWGQSGWGILKWLMLKCFVKGKPLGEFAEGGFHDSIGYMMF